MNSYGKRGTPLLHYWQRYLVDRLPCSSMGGFTANNRLHSRSHVLLVYLRPPPPRPVASEYMMLSGQHEPHPGEGRGPSPRAGRIDER